MRVSLQASFTVGAVLSVIAQVRIHSEDESSAIPVAISRRSSLDILTIIYIFQGNYTGSTNINCDVKNATYLVKENECINDQYLFNSNKNA